METLDDPSLPSPVIRALLTETYEQGQKSASIRWGKKMAKLKEQSVEIALAGGFIGSICTLVFGSAILVAIR